MMRSHPWKPLVMLACACFALTASSASAEHVQCGEVITQNTTLDSDLVDCPGDGIVIGADGVALDLAGHMVDGQSNVQDPEEGTTGVGARGFNDVVIRNGRVNEFLYGVIALHTSRSLLRGVTVTSCCGLNNGIVVG